MKKSKQYKNRRNQSRATSVRGLESSAPKTTPRARLAGLPRKHSRSGLLAPPTRACHCGCGRVGWYVRIGGRSQDTGHGRIYSNTSVIRGAATADSINFGLRSGRLGGCYCSYLTVTTLSESTLCPTLRTTRLHSVISSTPGKKKRKQNG